MTRYKNEYGTLNSYNISPDEVLPNDRYGYKIVAVINYDGNFWTAFRGLTEWSDQEVEDRGESISEEVAIYLFPSLQYGREYYR